MLWRKTPKWKMALVRMLGERVLDDRGRHVCYVWRGVPYFRLG